MLSVYDTSASTGAFNMAVDEYTLKNMTNAVLRFYRWEPLAVSFGRFQSIATIDLGECESHGIDVVRRLTG
jgi:lipoate-protein ligase A